MKERISNVLAWFGFSYPALFWFGYLVSFTRFDALAKFIKDVFFPEEPMLFSFVAFGLYPCCAIANYLLVGRFRLLPWVEK
tara:strand:+ start:266 stop:508 length:243 start_codon:yes stop_codon:yes gene_type:complete